MAQRKGPEEEHLAQRSALGSEEAHTWLRGAQLESVWPDKVRTQRKRAWPRQGGYMTCLAERKSVPGLDGIGHRRAKSAQTCLAARESELGFDVSPEGARTSL